jgi:hypothetical protein
MALTPTQKRKLLERISAGMDPDSSAAELGIPVSELTRASKRLAAQIGDAVREGSARLRGRLYRNALQLDDVKYLQDILNKRAEAAAAEPITTIERKIISSPCQKCGHKQKLLPATTPKGPTNGAAT